RRSRNSARAPCSGSAASASRACRNRVSRPEPCPGAGRRARPGKSAFIPGNGLFSARPRRFSARFVPRPGRWKLSRPRPTIGIRRFSHGPEHPDRARSRRVPQAGRASARAHRRAEYRPDESCRFLPQLPVALVSRGGGGAQDSAQRSRRAENRLRHAVRRMEGEIFEGSLAGAESRVRRRAETLIRNLGLVVPAKAGRGNDEGRERPMANAAARRPNRDTDAVLAALRARFGERLATATSVLEQHGRDESYHTTAPPDAVV